jgi:NAD(P)-dependent dehydrogenase (short-subunit alcohol dehydrogenase family)
MLAVLADKDALGWRYTQEVNVRGVFNYIQYVIDISTYYFITNNEYSAALPELVKTRGQIVMVSSLAAHARFPKASDYLVHIPT